jgi:hypothetical protein
MSQLISSSKPPARAEPFAAAIEGLGEVAPRHAAETLLGGRHLALGEGLEVHAGGEGLVAGVGQYHDPDVVVALALVEGLGEGHGRGAVDGVAGLGSVDRQQFNVPAPFAQYFVGHRGSFERPERAPGVTLAELVRGRHGTLVG